MKKEIKYSINNQLINRYQKGEKKALELLIKRFHPLLIRAIDHFTGHSGPAEDIAQEFWVQIIPKLKNIRLEIGFDAYAMTIARRRSIDWIREEQSKVRQKRIIERESGLDEPVDEREYKSELSGLLDKGIIQLTPTQQIVLRMHYLESLSIHEISDILRLSTGTVKSRLFYARENLKTIIKKEKGEL